MSAHSYGGKMQKYLTRIAEQCRAEQRYQIREKSYDIRFNWRGIEEKLGQILNRKVQLIGGFYPQNKKATFLPSFGAHYPTQDLLVINVASWRWKILFALRSDLDIKDVISMLLSHEARHIQQGIHSYGLKGWIILPGILAGPFAVLITTILSILRLLDWKITLSLAAYYMITLLVYRFDRYEIDARKYAKDSSQEWEKYITVQMVEK